MAFKLHFIRHVFDSRVARTAAIVLSLIFGMSIALWQFETRAVVTSDDVVVVQPKRFRITRDFSGTIEPIASSVSQSACHWTVSILSLVPEGTWVEQGDVVCVLDSAEIQEFLRSREISLIRANAALTASLKQQELQQAAAERRLSDAKFLLQSAEMELRQYVEGTYPKQMERLQKDIRVSETQAQTASEDLGFVNQLWMTGLANRAEVDLAEFSATTREEQLRRLQGQQTLLEKFSNPKMLRQLEHRVDYLNLNLIRTDLSNSLAETRSRMIALSDQRRLDIYERYARTARESIDACTLRAPRSGRVIHANNWWARSRGIRTIEEGKSVYFSQAVFEIPDESELMVSFPLDEALVYRARVGMSVEVSLPGFEHEIIPARIERVSNYPRSRFVNGTELREYVVEALLMPTDNQRQHLHSQMDATVTMALTDDPETVVIPKDAVVRVNNEACVLLQGKPASEEFVRLAITPGEVHDGEVQILAGLHPGDRILRNAASRLD